jgi:hypothetical protein
MKLSPAFVPHAHTLALNHSKSLQIGQRLAFNQLPVLPKAAHFTLLGASFTS